MVPKAPKGIVTTKSVMGDKTAVSPEGDPEENPKVGETSAPENRGNPTQDDNKSAESENAVGTMVDPGSGHKRVTGETLGSAEEMKLPQKSKEGVLTLSAPPESGDQTSIK